MTEPMKTKDLTKAEAIEAMKAGKKVRHRYFSYGEYVAEFDDKNFVDENGYKLFKEIFWAYRNSAEWKIDWEIV